MLNELRKELQALLAGTECRRPPALRRSLREDFLYATDLPETAEEAETEAFCRRAGEAGWKTEREGNWIQLDAPGKTGGGAGFHGPFGPEAACCASLLRRHTAEKRDGARERRLLIKAGEEGPESYEKACALLHGEAAAALRRRDGLPEIPLSYFGEEKGTC